MLVVGINAAGNAQFQSAQLSETAQASQAGVAGVGGLVQVVNHLVTVVGAHDDTLLALLFQFQ